SIQPVQFKDLKILVCDDNASAREISQNILSTFGCIVEMVSSGEEAITEVETKDQNNEPYDAVFLDWKMHGMNGLEASDHLINKSKLMNLPKIVISSAYSKHEVYVDSSTTVDGFLPKPITASNVFDCLMNTFSYKQEDAFEKKSGKIDENIELTLQGARVLLVEDNEVNQELAYDILTKRGLLVDICENGQEATERVNSYYDVVLMDINMPIMDGYRATEVIRKNPEFKDLPIIAMTANAMSGDKEKSINAGMNDHINKPIDIKSLFTCLSKWVTVPEVNKNDEPQPVLSIETTIRGWDKLEQISEIDKDFAFNICSGSFSLYAGLLEKFYKRHLNFKDEYIKEKQKETAEKIMENKASTRLAHTLKGTSANLGIHIMEKEALNLEIMSKEDSKIEIYEPQLEKIHLLLQTILPKIKTLIVHNDEEEKGGLTKKVDKLNATEQNEEPSEEATLEIDLDKEVALDKMLEEIKIYLLEDNTQATVLSEKLYHMIKGSNENKGFKLEIEKLNHACKSFKYDIALEIIDVLKNN
ncbi:MAG: response regulator, partial [Gammaproteobacteria bacterium]|nr:response regulator [Gammaproteobacteria bacterium]